MFDQTYEDALAAYRKEKWEFEHDPELKAKAARKYDCHSFEEWDGPPPDPLYYRPTFKEEPTHYQIYENVSEGTPTSPVFCSLEDLEAWLVDEGYSAGAAASFVEHGWAPSFVMSISPDGSGQISEPGIGSWELLKQQE
jgi:hypothetical protein